MNVLDELCQTVRKEGQHAGRLCYHDRIYHLFILTYFNISMCHLHMLTCDLLMAKYEMMMLI